jgi:phosphoribosylanthranilate isomerase
MRWRQHALQRVVCNVSLAMFVKICGITNQVDAELAIVAGADALGFNFWPGSRRYLEPASAADWIGDLPETVVRVGVVVNPTESYATTIAAIEGIDFLQLHGVESPEFCLNLIEANIPLWKTIPMTGPATCLLDYHVERILLDTAGREIWRNRRAISMELGA